MGHAGRAEARRGVSVRIPAAFTGTVDAVYNTADAEKLEVGVHGPVRYLRSDPEATVGIETRLSEEKVQQIYRAAAMN